MSFLATTGGISGHDVRDLMVAAVEHRFGRFNRLPVTIEWLSDNGSCYIAGDTRAAARGPRRVAHPRIRSFNRRDEDKCGCKRRERQDCRSRSGFSNNGRQRGSPPVA